MRLPVIVVNFKAYAESVGRRGWALAEACARTARDSGASIVIAPAAPDLAHIAKTVRIPVFGQHVDSGGAGARTGWVPPEALLEAGAAGTLINHSERKVPWEVMQDVIPRSQKLGLEVIACADSLSEAERIAKLAPEYVAVEPPELIGGDVSVTTAKPEIVSDAVERVRIVNPAVQVLCGAGVKTQGDVRKAVELGSVGVLLASGVVLAKDPERALRNLVKGLR